MAKVHWPFWASAFKDPLAWSQNPLAIGGWACANVNPGMSNLGMNSKLYGPKDKMYMFSHKTVLLRYEIQQLFGENDHLMLSD